MVVFRHFLSNFSAILLFIIFSLHRIQCFSTNSHTFGNTTNTIMNYFNSPSFCSGRSPSSQFTLHSRRSIETVIHTGDYKNYDPNCIKYRKAKYWRDKPDEELQEEIRKIRKVLVKIEECIRLKDPSLLPDSKRNAKRTQAQLLFLLHERHLNSLRNSSKNTNSTDRTKSP